MGWHGGEIYKIRIRNRWKKSIRPIDLVVDWWGYPAIPCSILGEVSTYCNSTNFTEAKVVARRRSVTTFLLTNLVFIKTTSDFLWRPKQKSCYGIMFFLKSYCDVAKFIPKSLDILQSFELRMRNNHYEIWESLRMVIEAYLNSNVNNIGYCKYQEDECRHSLNKS